MLLKRINYLFITITFIIVYMHIGTGLYSDDYVFLNKVPNWTLSSLKILWSDPQYYLNIPFFLFYFIQIYLIDKNFILYDLIKIIVLLFSLLLTYRFLVDYISKYRAILIAVLFILYPIHDATNYCPINQYQVITAALVMYAHSLINAERYFAGLFAGLFASFFSYASPPMVFGLSIIFLLKKNYKRFTLFILPQFIYISSFYVMKPIVGVNTIRTEHVTNPIKYLKLYMLQVLSGLDVAIGPSFFLKVYYSIVNLSLYSAVIGCVTVYIFYRFVEIKKEPINVALFWGVVAIMPLTFGMFALTGYYPQMAFGLGNRVTTLYSLTLSFLVIFLFMQNKWISTIVFIIFIFSVLGISDHWKAWNKHQMSVINNIRNNRQLQDYKGDKVIFVSGNQYSKYGKLSHIEFFSEHWVPNAVFRLAHDRNDVTAMAINKRFKYINGQLVDTKSKHEININDYINVYDSEKDVLLKIDADGINSYISSLPLDTRHWIQMLGRDNVIKKIILYLMPRLEYAF